ncbi:MAG: FixH family protein [bacterium]|jgi:nitrogen fixation protein FixH|nr:FixH family protein [Planctomycetaceae bacterium]
MFPTPDAAQSLRRTRLWPGLIVALLGLNVLGAAALIYLATGDASMAVEKDYYAKAVAWDRTAAQLRRNKELGWQAEPGVRETLGGGAPVLQLRLIGADSKPIDGATVQVTAFHQARAADQRTVFLGEGQPGTYQGDLRLDRAGWWEIRVSARRGSDAFTAVQSIQVPAAGVQKVEAGS